MTRTRYDELYIGGAWTAPAGRESIPVHSAATEEEVGSVPLGVEADIDAAVEAARAAWDDPGGWARWSPQRRAEAMERFAAELEARGEETARRVSIQNGMPIALARRIEATAPARLLRYYGNLVRERGLEERRPGAFSGATLVVREPVGVVGAVVPWNVPQSISFMKIAPALAAGCTVVLKPAPETVLDAFLMAEAAIAAGLPAGVLNVVPGGGELGARLVAHPGVDKVSFTGSTAAGRVIAETCGRLLRPVTLELGGKSAAVVLDDADLAANIERFFAATLLNNGQICYLGTRVLAPRSRYGDVVDTVTALAASLVVGDPLDAGTQLGPLVSARQRDRVESYIAKGLAEGDRLTTGGGRPTDRDRGWFVEPAVFADVDPRHTIAQEEIFGPVLAVIPYADEAEAVAIANGTDYGLGGSVWSADPERATAFARKVHSGSVGVNHYANDVGAPFGGVRHSGIGREFGPEGLAAYQQPKSIYLDPSAATAR
ncbi:aldehyde dehydrogenase [Streptomyces sp. MMG1533]|uniref:aldehyde dehydrogenase n=1 Tax=Streptomyces sp. MMG1533 TaxID=1415546 RepID=UPI0006AF3E3D|nr:aldehyde dehydrogenase [Streptomyces sp. MMG1533]KOU59823.1 aldehyde dehydrogenase [Streptomyces sp. MMG1533]